MCYTALGTFTSDVNSRYNEHTRVYWGVVTVEVHVVYIRY